MGDVTRNNSLLTVEMARPATEASGTAAASGGAGAAPVPVMQRDSRSKNTDTFSSSGSSAESKQGDQVSNPTTKKPGFKFHTGQMKLAIALLTPVVHFTIQIAKVVSCGKDEDNQVKMWADEDAECPDWPENLDNWMWVTDILCEAGITVGLVGFVHDLYLVSRKGGLGGLAEFFGESCCLNVGKLEADHGKSMVELCCMTALEFSVPVLSVGGVFFISLADRVFNVQNVAISAVAWVIESICGSIILSAVVCLLFEAVVCLYVALCQRSIAPIENFTISVLACDRNLEDIGALSLEAEADDGRGVHLDHHSVKKDLAKKHAIKTTGAWIKVSLEWITFLNMVWLATMNQYWEDPFVSDFLGVISAICNAGLCAVIVMEVRHLCESGLSCLGANSLMSHLANGRVGFVLSPGHEGQYAKVAKKEDV